MEYAKLPFEIPNDCLKETFLTGIVSSPAEKVCVFCHSPLVDVISNGKAMIFTRFGVVRNVNIWNKHICFSGLKGRKAPYRRSTFSSCLSFWFSFWSLLIRLCKRQALVLYCGILVLCQSLIGYLFWCISPLISIDKPIEFRLMDLVGTFSATALGIVLVSVST